MFAPARGGRDFLSLIVSRPCEMRYKYIRLILFDEMKGSLMSLRGISFVITIFLLCGNLSLPTWAQENRELVVLKGKAGVEAVFEVRDSFGRWIAYRDVDSGHNWDISGHYFRLLTTNGQHASGGENRFTRVTKNSTQITLEMDISSPLLTVRQTYSFCEDNRTLRIQTSLRSRGKSITIKQIGLLEITVSGEKLHLTGPNFISFPVFGERIFAGIEHPSAECGVQNDTLSLSQSPYKILGKDWIDLPAAVFGSASDQDFFIADEEGLRRAFIRYLDGVRIKPNDMHIHYNDWWTSPQPSSEAFVLKNINTLKKNLYDETGFFFDSYALDEGWADRHSVWEINKDNFPDGFKKIRDMLSRVGSRPGLWISPSGLYPNSLDNHWLSSQGYEVTPNERLGLNPCLAVGGHYQTTLKKILQKHVHDNNLAHVKFDGFVPSCDVSTHGHPTGLESYLPVAEGLMEIFDTLRAIDPNIALEPTCFGYQASPWWLMHVPFNIGPFGDDSPKGRSPSPDWIESMTTARDIRNLEGRDAFLMPGSALQTFDIVIQSPGAFQNHAVMAIGRGRWFISCYINPAFMDAEEWQFFAELMTWARHNRQFLQEPIPIGGNPSLRQAYGYAFREKKRELYCLRNPWMEETFIDIPRSPMNTDPREVRSLYPRRENIAKLKAEESLPGIHLGPYETKFIEIVTIDMQKIPEVENQTQNSKVSVTWNPSQPFSVTSTLFKDEPQAFGASWSCPEGDTKETRMLKLEGDLEVKGALQTNLSILCEGRSIKSAFPQVVLTIDGNQCPVQISRSVGAFSAGGYTDEDWVWIMTPFPEGKHHVALTVKAFTNSASFGVFLRGTVEAHDSLVPFESGPGFPLYQPELINWSHVIVSPTVPAIDTFRLEPIRRHINHINGIYLDTMDWIEATAGWGQIQLNHSIKGQSMTMGGQIFHRGIGTHAFSRIVYKRPENHDIFAATIGCDQKALVGSLVFVVEGDGKELFRSPVFRADSMPESIRVPIGGINEIALVLEDGGDRINADHGNWANARFLQEHQ